MRETGTEVAPAETESAPDLSAEDRVARILSGPVTEEREEVQDVEAEAPDAEVEDDLDAEFDEEDELEESDEERGEVYTVRVAGEDLEVTLDEALQGYQRQSDYTRRVNEIAQTRKEYEAGLEEIASSREQVTHLLGQLQGLLTENLGQEPDWDSLYERDPIAATRAQHEWNQRVQRIRAAESERAEQAQKARAEMQQALRLKLQEEEKTLLEKLPEWADGEVRARERNAITQYGLEQVGFSEEELERVAYDHRAVLVLRKAMLYDEALEAGRNIRPKVKRAAQRAAPGTKAPVRSKRVRSSRREKAVRERFGETRRERDAVPVVESILNRG